MSKIKSNPIDTICSPLYGKILIESSAGTGKTFSLVIIYLRLLLGITNNIYYNRRLLVKEILVVTFTEHSKEELRSRIKKYITIFKKICIKQYSNDHTLKNLLSKITNLSQAIKILSQAENSIHEQAIHTIHGFCYQILKSNILNSELVFKNKILKNKYLLYLNISIKFWEYYFKFLPKNITAILLQYFDSPQSLLKKIFPLLNNIKLTTILTKKKTKNVIQLYYILIKKIKTFQKKWLKYKDSICSSIEKTNINKHCYTQTNLTRWIKNITKWATQESIINFLIPKELKYFKKSVLISKTISGITPENQIFKLIENFLDTNFSLKKNFIIDASLEIKNMFLKEKKIHGYFEYDDLITYTYDMLRKDSLNISKKILSKYPAALIDEFQDTNNQQYKIFKKIYKNKKNLLILIGDPKQAIYNFRGANILSYLQAKSDIKTHYHLDTNWRSSPQMINCINLLFSKSKNTFLTKRIKYYPIKSCDINNKFQFKINGKKQPSLRFLLNKKINITEQEYKTWISSKISKYIYFWLTSGKQGNAIITTLENTRNITSNDIAIIVRNNLEADLIESELKKLNLSSIYLSSKKDVFHSTEALEILWILQAILNPKIECLLKRAMSTNIMSKNVKQIIAINHNHAYWIKILQEFNQYLTIWNKNGIFYTIQQLILNQKISNTQNISDNITPNITNILHIGNLLEKKSIIIQSKFLLINWLEQNISYNFGKTKLEYIQFNNNINNNCIKIVTIHKSKGLEYPITIIPFATIPFKNTINICEKINSNLHYFNSTNESTKNFFKIEKYKFSEEIRLLYVALTRSSIHCSIGLASIKTKKLLNTEKTSNFNTSTLKFIIQSGKTYNNNNQKLYKNLEIIAKNKNIEITSKTPEIKNVNEKKLILNMNNKNSLNYRITKKFNYHYGYTSYSQLKINNSKCKNFKLETKNLFESKKIYNNCNKKIKLTPHNFPRGKNYGILIHKILKRSSFHINSDYNWLSSQLTKYNLEQRWLPTLKNWIYCIINKTLDKSSHLKLAKLNSYNYIKELEFLLPIKKKLTPTMLNSILKKNKNYLHISHNFNFNPIQGILTGSIDLIFCWKEKYFLIDYKSNWLGTSNTCYSLHAIKYTIEKNNYDFQYQLYSLVLHRYLTQRVKNYNFFNNFGGIYILFLRSINNIPSDNGIFYVSPDFNIIKKLEKIF